MKIPHGLLASLLALSLPLQAAIQTKEITYRAGSTEMKGFLAWDDAVSGKRPGIIVVHEWWGLNDYIRNRTRQLAALGYTALAADMYGGGQSATHPKDAGALAATVMKDSKAETERFEAALATLKAQPTVDPKEIAAIGYCIGGGIVLNMARQGLPLAAVVSFHGSLGGLLPVKPPVKAKILVCHGGADSFSAPEQIARFKEEMKGTDYSFLVFPGAKHGFTNPSSDEAAKKFGLDIAYNAEADANSWAAMRKLFDQVFPKTP